MSQRSESLLQCHHRHHRREYYHYRHHSQWLHATDLQAQYCVKMTGVFEGKMGTKRSPESFYLINLKIMAPKGHQSNFN